MQFGRLLYSIDRNYEESLHYFARCIQVASELGCILPNDTHRIGYAYWLSGEKEEAMEILRYIHQRPFVSGVCMLYIQIDPLFESLRNDPEFQQIERDLVERFQNKQAEIRQWLEENNMI